MAYSYRDPVTEIVNLSDAFATDADLIYAARNKACGVMLEGLGEMRAWAKEVPAASRGWAAHTIVKARAKYRTLCRGR